MQTGIRQDRDCEHRDGQRNEHDDCRRSLRTEGGYPAIEREDRNDAHQKALGQRLKQRVGHHGRPDLTVRGGVDGDEDNR